MLEHEAREAAATGSTRPPGTVMIGGRFVSISDRVEDTGGQTEAEAETEQAEQPAEQAAEEQHPEDPPRRRSTRTRAQVTPRPDTQRRGSRPPPRGPPLVVHLDLINASAKTVQ